MTQTIYLFGATSILGFNLARLFPGAILPFVTPHHRAPAQDRCPVLDWEDAAWPGNLFNRHAPDILLYCHAICDVPKCEAAPAWARAINVEGLRRTLAMLPDATRLVYVSSDHVFGGDGRYDETSRPAPISVYGATRVAAENCVLHRPGSLVIRVGLAIGPSHNGRSGHWDWLRYRSQRQLPITIVRDEYRSVVWAADLAERVLQLARSKVTGIRHVSSTRTLSRVELANHLYSLFGQEPAYRCASRYQLQSPHLGCVELATLYRGVLSDPLPSVVESLPPRIDGTESVAPVAAMV